MEIGKWAAESLLKLEPHNTASYILLSSIYAAKGKWEEVAKLRKGMTDKGLRKEPGCIWIRYKNQVHVFSAEDRSTPYSDHIYSELEKLNYKMVQEGYDPDMNSALHDVEDSEKIKMLNHHSEKLAIAFGLIFIPPGLPIIIVKNLRVFGDCHKATKYISKITQREILTALSTMLHDELRCMRGDFDRTTVFEPALHEERSLLGDTQLWLRVLTGLNTWLKSKATTKLSKGCCRCDC
ncbi:hypothetical protein Fmac_002940 [Flemingia macrophylla]|uniref:DYW domain-containing protein n=1 Tax=Flemingia macrophylla TaxID=520843 RepID=A0ABD1NLD9_9FABA